MVNKTAVTLLIVGMMCACSLAVAIPLALKDNNHDWSEDEPIEISLKKTPKEYHCMYTDAYFKESATVYNSSLATASFVLGMASLANPLETRDHHTDNARQMLTDAGFTNFEVNQDYLEEPREDTNGTFVASKVMCDKNGHLFTVLAIGFRWGDYGKEWVNNVDVGYGDEYGNHEGFKKSAMRSIDFINDYIERNGIYGHIKLWGSGYSRPSAIMNMLSGLIDTSIAEQKPILSPRVYITIDDIYAYTFESTLTVAPPAGMDVHGRAYSNIWNHMGAADLVPMIPSEKWGFTAYGHMLFYPEVNVAYEVDTPRWDCMLTYYDQLGEITGRDRDDIRIHAYALEWDQEGLLPYVKDIKNIDTDRPEEKLSDIVMVSVNAIMDNMASSRAEFVEKAQPDLEKFMGDVMRYGIDNFAVFFADFLLRLSADTDGTLEAGIAIAFDREDLFMEATDPHIRAAIEDAGLDQKDAEEIEKLFFKASKDTVGVLVKEFSEDPTMEVFFSFVGNGAQIVMQHADFHYYYSWLLAYDKYYG